MGTWSEPVGLGQNDPDHFSAIKDCVYSAFWAFRYVRAYGGDAYIAVEGEHLGIPENQRTKSVRWFSHIYREVLLCKIKWSKWPPDWGNNTKRHSPETSSTLQLIPCGHFDHMEWTDVAQVNVFKLNTLTPSVLRLTSTWHFAKPRSLCAGLRKP